MEIPREVYDIWKAVAEKFADLHRGSDDDRRLATRRGVATIRRRLQTRSNLFWVCKSEHATGWEAQSKDAIGFVPDDGTPQTGEVRRMFMFDMMNGTTRLTNPFPIVARNVEEGNPDAFVLIPVEEDDRDWLEGDVPPPHQPPTDDLAARVTLLEAKLAFIQESLALLLERVADTTTVDGLRTDLDGLTQRVDRLPAVQVKKGDPIEVRGTLSVPLLGSKTIISRGTL